MIREIISMSRKELIRYIRKSELFFASADFKGRSLEELINIKKGIERRLHLKNQNQSEKG